MRCHRHGSAARTQVYAVSRGARMVTCSSSSCWHLGILMWLVWISCAKVGVRFYVCACSSLALPIQGADMIEELTCSGIGEPLETGPVKSADELWHNRERSNKVLLQVWCLCRRVVAVPLCVSYRAYVKTSMQTTCLNSPGKTPASHA